MKSLSLLAGRTVGENSFPTLFLGTDMYFVRGLESLPKPIIRESKKI